LTASLQRLRYVEVAARQSLDGFPDFLILGPQRTGTTWLHAQLRFHPDIFLAEPKEIFFFSSLKEPESPRFRSRRLDWYLGFFRDPPWRLLVKNAITLWRYGELYRPRVRGEATASYAALDRDVIDEIVALNPRIRAILMIRNPVDRAWSHAKKDLLRKSGRRLEDVPEAELRSFLTGDYQRRCARFVEHCDNWSAALAEGHLLVRFFDEIATRPEALLLDVMAFLGVRAEPRYVSAKVRRAVNPTAPEPIPEQYRELLRGLFAPELESLRRRFGVNWE
jgi:hypothetical protein